MEKHAATTAFAQFLKREGDFWHRRMSIKRLKKLVAAHIVEIGSVSHPDYFLPFKILEKSTLRYQRNRKIICAWNPRGGWFEPISSNFGQELVQQLHQRIRCRAESER